MKSLIGYVVAFVVALALPAWATTFINADADSARIPPGNVSSIVPLTGGSGNGPRNAVNMPNQSNSNCALFNIPALPQVMSNAPSINCQVTFRDVAAVPASNVTFLFAAQAYPAGDPLIDTFQSTTSGGSLTAMAGNAQNRAIVSNPSVNFAVVELNNVPCGPECLGRPAIIAVCRGTATGDTVQLINLTCQE